MRFAYADPPYLGCCGLYGHYHPDGRCWDDVDTHARLIKTLCDHYPDGWALSLHEPSLRHLLPLTPDDCRTSPWVKPFASFKPNVNPAHAWEPIIWRSSRTAKDRGGREVMTVRDWCSASITLQRGLTGAKPELLCHWLFNLLGMTPDDAFVDLFPGSGAVSRAWENWCNARPLDFAAEVSG